MKLNEWGFRPLCAHVYRLNWARRTSWNDEDKRDDTASQTQDSKFEPWRSGADLVHLGHGGFPQYWISEQGRNIFFFKILMPELGSNPRSPTFQASSFNHCTRSPASNRLVYCHFHDYKAHHIICVSSYLSYETTAYFSSKQSRSVIGDHWSALLTWKISRSDCSGIWH